MGSGFVESESWDALRRRCRQQSTLVAHRALAPAMKPVEHPRGEMPAEPHRQAPLGGVVAVVFDCDHVLCDATLWRRWLLNVLARMGVATHYEAFFRVWDCEFYAAVCRGEREFTEAFVAFLHAVGLSRASALELATASAQRQQELEQTGRPHAGVAATLARLSKAGLRLGLLANSPHSSAELARQLARVGLGETITQVLSSRDLARAKPDRECYGAMCAGFGCPAREVAFVGHESAELAGAAAVGLRTVAFNYRRGAVADVYLQRFEQLASLVG